jgi:hypothetical protein
MSVANALTLLVLTIGISPSIGNSCTSVQSSYSESECCSGDTSFQLPAVSNPDVTKHVGCFETFKFTTLEKAQQMAEMLKMFLITNGTISAKKVSCSIYIDPYTNTTSCYSLYKTAADCMLEKTSLYNQAGVISMFDGLYNDASDVKCYFSFSSQAEMETCKTQMFDVIDASWPANIKTWFKDSHKCAYEKPNCAFTRSPFY